MYTHQHDSFKYVDNGRRNPVGGQSRSPPLRLLAEP